MRTRILIISILVFTIFSCEYRKSVSKNLLTDLTTKGDGLSCGNVYLSFGGEEINRNTFIYGERFSLKFENIEGFKKENDYTFPGMQLLVLDKAGEEVLRNDDVYADQANGVKRSQLDLIANITVADPIASDASYILTVNIWDKKGSGKFTARLDFIVKPNDKIKIEKSNLTYDEIYLFSEKEKIVLIDNEVKFNDNIFMIFEGLSGFSEEEGKVFLGLSMKAIDSQGELILDEHDLIGNTSMDVSRVNSQIAPNFIFSGSSLQNPVTCTVTIWDKKSNNSIKATVDLNVK